MKTNLNVAQGKQKKGYDERNDVDHCTELKKGDRVWINNKAVPKGLSRKFHFPWAGPYVVLGRLGRVNYHIKPVSGNGKAKVVHRNRHKLDGRQSRMEETWPDRPPKLGETRPPKGAQANQRYIMRRSLLPTHSRYKKVSPSYYGDPTVTADNLIGIRTITWMNLRSRTLSVREGGIVTYASN